MSHLHQRMPLPLGVHSGVLLTSISLPTNGKPGGRVLRSGTRVHVRATRPADLLHREWFLVDPSKGKERGGLVVASIPAPFVWLDSPESSPDRNQTQQVAVKRSLSVPAISQKISNSDEVDL